MKKIWAVRKDAEGVSPVIATILMVAITVVLAAVLYVMVLGFGGTSTQTPTSSLTKSTVTNGVKMTFAPVSVETQWSDVTILLSDGTDTIQWQTVTTDLDDGETTKATFTVETLDTAAINVYCNVTDLAGNGYVNQGDFFVLTTGGANSFSSAATYTVTIMHDPTAAEICHLNFQG